MSYSVRPHFSRPWAGGGGAAFLAAFLRWRFWAAGFSPGMYGGQGATRGTHCPSSSPKLPRQPSFHLAEFFCVRGHQHTMKCNSISLRSSVKVIHPCSHHYNRTFHHNRKFPCAPPSHSFPPHPRPGLPWSVFCHHRFGFGSHSLAQSTALKVGWAH